MASSSSATTTATSAVVATPEKEEEDKTATSSSSSNVNSDTAATATAEGTTTTSATTSATTTTTTTSNVTTTTTTTATTEELKLPYHEKQSRANQLCLVHAINMIVGSKIVSKSKLDQICNDLVSSVDPISESSSWFNPHRSIWGTGNYDANVAMVALQQLGYETKFFDKRKPITELPLIKEDSSDDDQESEVVQVQGCFLVNIQGTTGTWKNLWHFPFIGDDSRRHWLVIKRYYNNIWFILDSKLDGPKRIDDNDIVKCLQSLILDEKKDNHIIIVEKKEKNNNES